MNNSKIYIITEYIYSKTIVIYCIGEGTYGFTISPPLVGILKGLASLAHVRRIDLSGRIDQIFRRAKRAIHLRETLVTPTTRMNRSYN